jgi:hypothetical protein
MALMYLATDLVWLILCMVHTDRKQGGKGEDGVWQMLLSAIPTFHKEREVA